MHFVDKSATKCTRVRSNAMQYRKKVQKVWKTIDNNYWLTIVTKICCIDKVFYIWLGFAGLDVKICICFWCRLFIFIVGTTFLILADGTKQARPMGYSNIYQSKLHLKHIFFQVKYLGAYVHILLFSSGDVFILLLKCYYVYYQQVSIALQIQPNLA